MMFCTPLLEKASIAGRQVGRAVNTQPFGSAVDPRRRSLQLRVVTNRRLVDDAMALIVRPLAAPLFIAKCFNQPQRLENLRHHIAVGHLGFRLNAMLVRILARSDVGQPLVRHRPLARIASDAQNLSPRAHPAVRRVIQNVALERPRRLLPKPRLAEPDYQLTHTRNPEFDLRLDSHR